ncbi:MAG: superoxide dismutase [Gammaproteobacteria bacterium]|nr:superoxide dismutase [Gammaproteobacteria bacterium]MBV8405324.1 superoxide dismutase [Gammaproteobacteria bacterium]
MATTQSAIVLPPLPYANNALEPYMSRETLDYHYGKHHKAYVDKVNSLISGTEFEDASLEELVAESTGEIFNNAAQAWNHAFFWNCLSPRRQSPGKEVTQALESLGGLETFQSQFDKAASGLFGSGWAWLIKDTGGRLKILTTSNANTPVRDGHVALLTCDMWEHAYYIDRRNDRAAYLKNFWPLVNWEFVAANLSA